MVPEISVQELKTKIDAGEACVLLDVRESEEVEIACIANAMHIPMGEIPGRLHELDPDANIVVYCHHGIRSMQVAQFLSQHDFEQVVNLAGGIEAWAVIVEPGMARY
jgi:rhodanese-related sulfurtransferase